MEGGLYQPRIEGVGGLQEGGLGPPTQLYFEKKKKTSLQNINNTIYFNTYDFLLQMSTPPLEPPPSFLVRGL